MYPPKPPDLDPYGNPVNHQNTGGKPPDLDEYGSPVVEKPGILSQMYHAAADPMSDIFSRTAKKANEYIDKVPLMQQTGQEGFGNKVRDWLAWQEATSKGALQGALEGGGELADTMLTSPLGIATLGTGATANLATRAATAFPKAARGLTEIASGLSTAGKVAGLPFAAHGGYGMGSAVADAFDPDIPLWDTAKKFGQGAAEFAGGVVGLKHKPTAEGPIMRRMWPLPKEEANVSPLLDKLRTSLDADKARSAETLTEPITLAHPWDNQQIKDLKKKGYTFGGIDEQGNMTLHPPDSAGPPAASLPIIEDNQIKPTTAANTKEEPFANLDTGEPYLPFNQPPEPVGELPQEQPQLPGVGLEEGPMEGGFNRPGYGTAPPPSGLPPRFAYHDAGMFNPPEPFYHLPDDSTISGQEMDRRGIQRPETPPFQQQVLGEPTPPPFNQQVLGDEGISNRDMFQRSEQMEQQPPVTPQLPYPAHEFAPDIVQNQQFVPETEGHTPLFNQRVPEQLPPAEPSFMDRVNSFFRDETGEGNIGEPDEEGPLWSKRKPIIQKLKESFGQQVLPGEPQLSPESQGLVDQAQGVIKSTIKSDITSQARELTSGYNKPLPAIMAREGVQNALDAFEDFPGFQKGTGKITYHISASGIELSDNGKGMSPQELDTVFTTLHGSGKRNDPSAKGGKGVGKAPYILGGANFKIETVKEVNGKKILSTFSGTPDELMDRTVPFDIKFKQVDPSTPTGTTFRTDFAPGQDRYDAQLMMDKIEKYSRDIPHTIADRSYGAELPLKLSNKSGDKSIINEEVGNGAAKAEVLIPHDAKMGTRTWVDVHYLNNGLYQFEKTMHLAEETPGIPDNLIVDITSLVKELDDKYPFPLQRESLKEPVQNDVEALIKDKLINPFASQKKLDLAKLWNQMPTVQNPSGTRPTVFFDPGDRLTPAEKLRFQQSPTVQNLTQAIDKIIEEVLVSAGKNNWRKKLERVGIILSNRGEYGIHIPNPQAAKGDPKSAILINPFANITNPLASGPADAAVDMVVTMMHEVAHIGSENPTTLPKFKPSDLTDPRTGRFLQTYMKEVMEQGGRDMGHGMPFIHRLGEVYATYGTDRGLAAATKIQQLISDPITGGYSPEVQRLLQIYDDSRGRPATTEDILSGTGTPSSDRGRTGEGDISGDDTGLPGGISGGPDRVTIRQQFATPETIKTVQEQGYTFSHVDDKGNFVFGKAGGPKSQPILESEVPPPTKGGKKPPKDIGLPRKLWDASRGAMSVDPPWVTSAAFRQALPWVGTKHWFESWSKAASAFGDEAVYQAQMKDILESPLFRPRPIGRTKTGEVKYGKSVAQEAGLRLTDITYARNSRMEGIRSQIMENVPIYGPYVKASNRAFSAFLNHLRRANFESFIKDGQVKAEAMQDPSQDFMKNLPNLKALGEFLNDTTGAGSLKTGIGTHEINLEGQANKLADVLFSPRLMARNIRMLNPNTYVMAPKGIRQAYVHAALRTVGAWWGFAQLLKLTGGQISTDPSNPDFGKIRYGDTRIDPAGGFQQLLVLGSRVKPSWMHTPGGATDTGIVPLDMMTGLMSHPGGTYSSSISGQNRTFGQGFNPPTEASNTIDFLANKLHPSAKLIYDVASTTERKPVYLGNRMIELYVPMMTGDLVDLIRKDPELIPLVTIPALTGVGMGVQSYTGEIENPQFFPEKYDFTIGGPKSRGRSSRSISAPTRPHRR